MHVIMSTMSDIAYDIEMLSRYTNNYSTKQ